MSVSSLENNILFVLMGFQYFVKKLEKKSINPCFPLEWNEVVEHKKKRVCKLETCYNKRQKEKKKKKKQ
jgi:hypothetical protein